MPRAYTCSLQASDPIQFPDLCVICGKPQPGTTHRYAVKQSLSLSRFGGWQRIKVPCCRGCGWRLDLGRVLRGARFLLITAAVTLPATWLLYHYTPLRDATLGGTVFGIFCVVLIVNGFWEMFHPPEFVIDVTGSTVSFEFRDRDRAEAFAAANGMSFAALPTHGE
ncbi:MAG: hypothetical protein JWM57_1286 [Phycisphaerales bacterium]|nr:hypothetical protein [Phycisphaerales bacterium]